MPKANMNDIKAFYEAVEEMNYSDCDDTVFCKCGASWYMHDYNMRHLRLVLNGMRLHRRHCEGK